MIRHLWTIPCRICTTNRDTNNLSLIEVLEEVTIPSVLPPPEEAHTLVPAFFELVTSWERENADRPERGYGRLSLISPQGVSLHDHEYEVNLSELQRMRSVMKFLALPANASGRYVFRTESRATADAPWNIVGEVPLMVNILPGINVPANGGAGERREPQAG
jgi:hypothetical protein